MNMLKNVSKYIILLCRRHNTSLIGDILHPISCTYSRYEKLSEWRLFYIRHYFMRLLAPPPPPPFHHQKTLEE